METISGSPGVEPEEAPAQIDQALRWVGDELRREPVKAIAADGDDPGVAEDGDLLPGGVCVLADAFGNLGDHELLPGGELGQDAPADGRPEGREGVFERQQRSGGSWLGWI